MINSRILTIDNAKFSGHYAIDFTPTESSAGGTLLYIASHFCYKPCPDLNIYKASQLESTFAEIINPKKSNIIVGSIYKHPNMDILDFKNNFLVKFLKYPKNENRFFLLVTLI